MLYLIHLGGFLHIFFRIQRSHCLLLAANNKSTQLDR